MSFQTTLDQIAEIYSEDHGFESVLMRYKVLEISKFLYGETMLDLGCGVGLISKTFSPFFKNITAIDGSSVKIGKALKSNFAPNIDYQCKVFEELQLDQKYDFIVACNVLEHLNTQSRTYFLKQVKDWVSPTGKVVMTVPNSLSLNKRIGKAMGLIDDFYTLTQDDHAKGHFINFDTKSLEQEFLRFGFKVDYLGGILLKPLSHAQMQSWEPKIVDALYEVGKDFPELCSSLIIVARLNE